MGLGDIEKEPDNSSGSKSSSGSSSSGGGGSFPQYKTKCPELLIKETGHGYEAVTYPETPAVACSRSWYTEDFTPDDHIPDNWEVLFWSKDRVRLAAHKVEKVLGMDLHQLLEHDPEAAMKSIREAANRYSPDKNTYRRKGIIKNCAVCDDELNTVQDKTQRVQGRVVCLEHTAGELGDADLL